jgi:four helix bundle protein
MRPTAAYKKLDAWQVAMDFVERCYQATKTFPRDELYGLTNQLRRAAVSVPSNVAEGYCRRGTRVYAHHVSIALGSHGELETCVEIAYRLQYLTSAQKDALDEHLASVGRLLNALHGALERRLRTTQSPSPPVP